MRRPALKDRNTVRARTTDDTGYVSLRESGARLKYLADDVFVGICLIQDNRFIYVNPRLVEITGRSAEELASEGTLNAILHPDDAAATLEGMDMVLSGALKSFLFQDRWIMKHGGVVEVDGAFTATPYDGKPALLGTVVDVTERNRLERQKTDFLAMVTHDFKVPLTSVLGFAELIECRQDLDQDVIESAAYITRSGRKLLGMVEDFMFHAMLESGELVPEFTPVKLSEVMGELTKEFSVQATNKEQTIELRCEPGLPDFMLDRKLVERAVANLVQNAVNYSGEGRKISLEADLRTDNDVDMIAISVSDAGPGIPYEQRIRLFEKYFRSATSSGVRGAGLGLTIVKMVAESHGGRVEVESKPGKGSTFVLLLPALKDQGER